MLYYPLLIVGDAFRVLRSGWLKSCNFRLIARYMFSFITLTCLYLIITALSLPDSTPTWLLMSFTSTPTASFSTLSSTSHSAADSSIIKVFRLSLAGVRVNF